MAKSNNKPDQQQIDGWHESYQYQIDEIWNSYHNGSYEAEDIPVQKMNTTLMPMPNLHVFVV